MSQYSKSFRTRLLIYINSHLKKKIKNYYEKKIAIFEFKIQKALFLVILIKRHPPSNFNFFFFSIQRDNLKDLMLLN